MKNAVVIKSHISVYPNPLKLSIGDKVTVETKECEWEGWLWCVTPDNKGWIPDNYVNGSSGEVTVIVNYDATELNVEIGDELIFEYELNGWGWCKNLSDEQGWVPMECIVENL